MEIVKSVFQSKSKRSHRAITLPVYSLLHGGNVGRRNTLWGLLSVAGIRNDQLEYCLHDRLCDEFYL